MEVQATNNVWTISSDRVWNSPWDGISGCLSNQEAEALRVDLERKYALFRNQDAKNEDQTIIDKTRSTIKALQTRMVVAIQAVDSAAQQVQKIRDEELYPQLLELLEGWVVCPPQSPSWLVNSWNDICCIFVFRLWIMWDGSRWLRDLHMQG